MPRVVIVVLLAVLLSPANIVIAAEEGPTREDITFVQGLLSRLGYDPGPADGICGDLTVSAVRALHGAHNLPLQPGDIEPQAATVVKNLTTIIKERITRPETQTSETYRKALEGDAQSAFNIGTIYFLGEKVAADNMLAYLWWTIAETNGNLEASKQKDNLVTAGQITDHEMTFATSLAEQIRELEITPDQGPQKKLHTEATM